MAPVKPSRRAVASALVLAGLTAALALTLVAVASSAPSGEELGPVPTELPVSHCAAMSYSPHVVLTVRQADPETPTARAVRVTGRDPRACTVPRRLGAPAKPKKLHLRATVSQGSLAGPIDFTLTEAGKKVGSVSIPECETVAENIFCLGRVSVLGIGSGLESLFTFDCTSTALTNCKPGVAGMAPKNGASLGIIELEVQPKRIKPGATFAVVVTKERGPKAPRARAKPALKPQPGVYSGAVSPNFPISFRVSKDGTKVLGLKTSYENTLCVGVPPSSDPEAVSFPTMSVHGDKFSGSLPEFGEKITAKFVAPKEVAGTVRSSFKVPGNPTPCTGEGEFTAKLGGTKLSRGRRRTAR
jgi:hypothetical protein